MKCCCAEFCIHTSDHTSDHTARAHGDRHSGDNCDSGAGPIGLEAALYARYLGYDVQVLEQDRVAARLRTPADLRMPSPFQELSTPLGLAALQAQDPDYKPPAPDAMLTGRQWIEQYLEPLANTDLVADHLHCGSTALEITILSAAQEGVHDAASEPTAGTMDVDEPDADAAEEDLEDSLRDRFQIAVRAPDGSESARTADIVLDISGLRDEDQLADQNSRLLGKLGVELHAATGGPEAMGAWLARWDCAERPGPPTRNAL